MTKEELEKAAKDYTDSKSYAKDGWLTPYFREAFMAGVEWMQKQDTFGPN